jgi:hypothetical protein
MKLEVSPRDSADLRRTAYHEAGHAVADFLLAIPLWEVTIVPDGERLGHVKDGPRVRRSIQSESDLTLRDREQLERRTVAAFAGPRAEAKATGVDVEPQISGDLLLIGNRAHLAGSFFDSDPGEQEAYMNWLRERARVIVEQGWYLIEALANELLTRPTLSGRAVQRLLRDVVTSPPAASPLEACAVHDLTPNAVNRQQRRT